MPLVACFLRAVNVGGRRTTNDELVAAATGAGFEDVAAYQAAGNLVLEAGARDEESVAEELEAALEQRLGFLAEVVVRTGEQLRSALDAVPWSDDERETAAAKPHLVLCRATPDEATTDQVEALGGDSDRLRVVGRELHWLPLGGMGRTDVDTTALYRLLHPATARTEGTLDRICTRFGLD